MAVFTNQATLTYGNRTTNSNLVTGEILQPLSVTKTALQTTYRAGDTVTYVVSLLNSGTAALNDVTVTDDLGAYAFGTAEPITLVPLTYVEDSVRVFLDGVPQTALPDVTAGAPLVISGLTVPANGNLLLVYQAVLGEAAPPVTGGSVTNTATVTGGGIAEPLTASETITAASSPNLTINKALTPGTVVENGTLTYTFTIQNFGNTETVADDNVTLTDRFSPILRSLTVTFNGEPWSAGTHYTYDETTGLFETVSGQITVPAASYTQDPVTGDWAVTPGVSVLTVTGTI